MILWTHNDFLSRRMRYPVLINCCKRPNYHFWISQGDVGKTTVIYVNFLGDVARQKLLKSVNVLRSYSKK